MATATTLTLVHQAPGHARARPLYYSPQIRQQYSSIVPKVADPQPPTESIADISYEYNEEDHFARKAMRVRNGGLRADLPQGWPATFDGPLVWHSSDYQDEAVFTYTLSDSDKNEVVNALQHFKSNVAVLL